MEKHKLIEVKYGNYKRTNIRIVSADLQAEFARAYDVSSVTDGLSSSDETPTGHPWNVDVSLVKQPIIERELERKLETGDSGEAGIGKVDVRRLIAEVFPDLGKTLSNGE
ncbi:MAG TPA: hypothetical protein VGE46_00335 [Bdellovibrio sp.]